MPDALIEALPRFNPRNREIYANCRKAIAEMDDLKRLATPADIASLDRYQGRLESGLSRKIMADTVGTVGLCAAQVGGIGFFPVLLTGSAPLLMTAAGCLLGGMALFVTSIFMGQGQPTTSLIRGDGAVADVVTYGRYKQLQEANAKQAARTQQVVTQKVTEAKRVLQKAAQPPSADAPKVEKQPEYVIVNGVRVEVRR